MNTNSKLKGKVYIIYGATGGIGNAVCRNLISLGAQIFLVGRDTDKLKSLSEELSADYYQIKDINFFISSIHPKQSHIQM